MGYYMDEKAERNAAWLRALHGIESEEPPPESEGPPDFDGGARDSSAPVSTDPTADLNAFLAGFLTGDLSEWESEQRRRNQGDPSTL